MKHQLRRDVQRMEDVMAVCCGSPKGDELPQIEGPDDIIMSIVQMQTGKPWDLVDAEFHHQTDPSYQ